MKQEKFYEILRTFGFRKWDSTIPLSDYYVHLRISGFNWMLKTQKKDNISTYEKVKEMIIKEESVIINTARIPIDSGGRFYEEGERIEFSNGSYIYITIPLY